MALSATVYRWKLALSDVDRQVYETLDLRLARHPSESMRYLVTRALAYALSYEEGIAFSKGGLSDTDEPPISVFDPTGVRTAWIDVGSPAADRLHKAAKATPRVSVFTHETLDLLRREIAKKPIHRATEIAVSRIDAALLAALEARLERNEAFEVVRTDGGLYVTHGAVTLEGAIHPVRLTE